MPAVNSGVLTLMSEKVVLGRMISMLLLCTVLLRIVSNYTGHTLSVFTHASVAMAAKHPHAW